MTVAPKTTIDESETPLGVAHVTQKSMRSRSLRASAWLFGFKPLHMAITLFRSMILTRLLFPEAFGLMALVQVVNQGVNMFSDIGIGPSIVQNKRGEDPEFLRTAWTLGIIRGVILWGVVCLLSWPMAQFFGEPLLMWMLPVVGLGFMVWPFGTTAWNVAGRRMAYGRTSILATTLDVIGLMIVIGLALWLRSVWALVIGNVVTCVVHVIAGHLFLPGIRHRFRLEPEAVRAILKFGKWVFLSTIVTFFAMQGDKLLLGKLINFEMLGIYSLAMVLTMQVHSLAEPLTSAILFPIVSEQVRESPNNWTSKVMRARELVLKISLLATLGVAVIAPAFFELLYDSRYWAAGWMAQWLALSAWASVLLITSGNVLLGIGNSRVLAIANTVNMMVTIPAALVGFWLYGIAGFILGCAAGTFCAELVEGWSLRRQGAGVMRQDAVWTLAGLVTYAIFLGLQKYLFNDFEASLLVRTSTGLILVGLLAVFLWPGLQRELFPDFRWKRLLRRLSGGAM